MTPLRGLPDFPESVIKLHRYYKVPMFSSFSTISTILLNNVSTLKCWTFPNGGNLTIYPRLSQAATHKADESV
jgi:hypothetical protein